MSDGIFISTPCTVRLALHHQHVYFVVLFKKGTLQYHSLADQRGVHIGLA